jgi:3-deoxy-7-phosphoheptulonate synthase
MPSGSEATSGHRSERGLVPSLTALHALAPQQQPAYPDPAAVEQWWPSCATLPPLVFAGECDALRQKMANVAAGEAFVLQGGDCAETLDGVTAANIQGKLRTLLSMAVVLTYAAQVPIVKIGRLAGQFAKPRSADTETREASPARVPG